MPPLPTSLSVVALVVAWLVVLVPMAARRREKVPDSDERSAGFRVLRRSARRRQRRVLSRTAVVAGDTDADELNAEVDPMDEQTLWSDEDDLADDVENADWVEESAGGRAGSRGGRAGRGGVVAEVVSDEVDEYADDLAEEDDEDEDSDLAESLFDEDGEDADDGEEAGVGGLVGRADGYPDDAVDEDGMAARGDGAASMADPRAARYPAAAGARTAWRAAPDADRWKPDQLNVGYDAGYSDAADEWAAEHPAARASRGAPEPEGPFGGDLAGRSGRVLVSRGADEQRSDSGVSGDPGRTVSTRANPAHANPAHANPAHAYPAHANPAHANPARSHPEPADAGYAETAYADAAGYAERDDTEPGYEESGYAHAGYAEPAGIDSANVEPADVDPAALRPVPRRPGRGGFDPEAAAKAKAYRYRRRRRVTLVLLFATVVFTLVSVFLIRTAWVGAAVCGVLLVGYLAYLRRQVRIEEAIRQRRMARLAQARQLRPDYDREYGRDGVARPPRGWEDDGSRGSRAGEYLDDPRATGYAAVGSPSVPPARYRSGTVVDFDDDDPAFSDLEYHQPLTYRRASGQ